MQQEGGAKQLSSVHRGPYSPGMANGLRINDVLGLRGISVSPRHSVLSPCPAAFEPVWEHLRGLFAPI
jgi:hypothetical protein